MGFSWLHCVDLDGAFSGHSANADAIRAIRRATRLSIQLGGGIRDMRAIEFWLAEGITRIVLGTAAIKNAALVREAAGRFPGQIAIAADARGGRIAVEGWGELSDITAVELARSFEDAGVAAILFTDVDRDGMLEGVNIEATRLLARAVRIPVIASGGAGNISDIEALVEAAEPNIAGIIIGRAFYDGRIDPAAALRISNTVRAAQASDNSG